MVAEAGPWGDGLIFGVVVHACVSGQTTGAVHHGQARSCRLRVRLVWAIRSSLVQSLAKWSYRWRTVRAENGGVAERRIAHGHASLATERAADRCARRRADEMTARRCHAQSTRRGRAWESVGGFICVDVWCWAYVFMHRLVLLFVGWLAVVLLLCLFVLSLLA